MEFVFYFVCGSRKKLHILPYVRLKIGFYNRGGECLLRGTHRVLTYHMRFVCKRLDERRLSQGTSRLELFVWQRSVREGDSSRNGTCRCGVLVSVSLQNGCS